MRKGQSKGKKGLSVRVSTRLSQTKFDELEALIAKTKGESVSSYIRKILQDKPIRIYTHDESLDILMEELAANRTEIKKIGVNINQLAKLFNTYGDLKPKVFYAKNGYQRYLQLESNIDTLLQIVEQLAKRWLSG